MQQRLFILKILIGITLATTALAASNTISDKQLRGTQPDIKPGISRNVYLWIDNSGMHVRWVSDGKPALFSGRVQLSREVGKFERVNTLAGGWVNMGDDPEVLLFSATATSAVDGFDLQLSSGTKVTLNVAIDKQPLDPALMLLASSSQHPAKIPVSFVYR